MLTQLVMTHQLVLYVRSLLLWLFEAQDNEVIAARSSYIQLEKKKRNDEATPFDCLLLGYCVAHTSCRWKIVLGHSYKSFVGAIDIRKEGVEMLVQSIVECKGGISEINLSNNRRYSEGRIPL